MKIDVIAAAGSLIALAAVAGCSAGPASAPSPSTVTVVQAAPQTVAATPSTSGSSTSTSTQSAASVTIPSVAGRNMKIVEDELKSLGVQHVEYASRDPLRSVVVLPENWTVVDVEPGVGSTVSTAQTVVLYGTKR